MTDTRAAARAERADLLTLLESLAPEEWDAPTLCTRWCVREVVAHVIGYDALGLRGTLGAVLRGAPTIDRINATVLASSTTATPDALLSRLRAALEPSGLPAAFASRIALTDGMIHQQDIRRPLGRPRAIGGDRLTAAMDFALFAPPVRGAWRLRGVRATADDVGWTHGRGPDVHGPGEAILMAMAGRPAALADLRGPGLDRLAAALG